MGKPVNLTGQRFGRLVVISYNKEVSKQKDGAHWNCICDCGNETIAWAADLKRGHTVSCGCYRNKNSSDRMKKLNGKQWQDNEFRERHRDAHWKGGITPISKHLRSFTKQWDKDVRLAYNKKCLLTGVKCTTKNSTVHHLYAFNMIVLDAHDMYNIKIKEQIKDYTEEELKLLEDYVAEWHKNTSNGVLLCKEVHKLFHNLYGRGNNTPQQFEEFKKRYINGEFKNLL